MFPGNMTMAVENTVNRQGKRHYSFLMPNVINVIQKSYTQISFLFRCFLFNLVNSKGLPPTRFDVIRPKYATLSHIR